MKTLIRKQLLVLACMLSCIDISAYDFAVDGIYYNITSAVDLTCSVTRGEEKYSGNIVIPETASFKGKTLTVESIEDSAFYRCGFLSKAIDNLTIGNSVKRIGDNVFSLCRITGKLTIANSVESIGRNAFAGSDINDVVFEDGGDVLYISSQDSEYWDDGIDADRLFVDYHFPYGDSLYLGRTIYYYGESPLFNYCNPEKSKLTIGDKVTCLNNYLFSGLPSSLIIEDCIDSLEIKEHAFYRKGEESNLKKLHLGRNLSFYVQNPFWACIGLKDVSIGNNVTKIKNSLFEKCSGIANIILPNSVTCIEPWAFSGCSNLANIVIPNSVTSIGMGAFARCGFTSVELPNSITGIGDGAFADCSSLTSINIPVSVEYISTRMFSGCSALTTITLPYKVRIIQYDVFQYCTNLMNIKSMNPIPPELYGGNYAFMKDVYINCNVYVPYGSLAAYQAADGWKGFWNMQELDPTGVDGIKMDDKKAVNEYYDINGRRLDEPMNGLNIINGKKVLMKM